MNAFFIDYTKYKTLVELIKQKSRTGLVFQYFQRELCVALYFRFKQSRNIRMVKSERGSVCVSAGSRGMDRCDGDVDGGREWMTSAAWCNNGEQQ